MGRKAKPPHLKLLMGNAGHRPIPDTVNPEPVLPDPPAFLSNEAADEWRRVAPMLHALGLLSAVDLGAFAAYCTAYGTWLQATTLLKDQDLIVKSGKGNKMQNVLVGVARRAAADVVRYAAEFGMTPAARARVSMPPRDSDPSDKYFR